MSERGLALVTGANGFVGSFLTQALLEAGYRVRCMVRRNSDLRFISDLPVEWAYADVRDAEGLRQACRGVRWVCHCAALTRAPDRETFFAVNALGAEAMGRAALEGSPDLERFLHISSHAAIGPATAEDEYLEESAPPHPVTWYGESKWAAEQALRAMDGRDGSPSLPLTIVRPSAVFGPRDTDFFAYFQLVQAGLRIELGRGERWLSLIYVADLADLCLRALESDAALGQTYFGCGTSQTQAEFSLAIAQALSKHTVQIRLPEWMLEPIKFAANVQQRLLGRTPLLNEQRIVDMQQRYWLCSGEKARRELGFQARYDLPTAVQETAAWYRENGWL
ncbi:MAG: NAD-dependent epimerase/dehydratase family protein [Anaerolineae bacterium]|jgi:nucleoside-diphosphate-sugar epimerase